MAEEGNGNSKDDQGRDREEVLEGIKGESWDSALKFHGWTKRSWIPFGLGVLVGLNAFAIGSPIWVGLFWIASMYALGAWLNYKMKVKKRRQDELDEEEETFQQMVDRAQETVEEVTNQAAETVDDVVDQVQEATDQENEGGSSGIFEDFQWDDLQENWEQLKEKTKEGLEDLDEGSKELLVGDNSFIEDENRRRRELIGRSDYDREFEDQLVAELEKESPGSLLLSDIQDDYSDFCDQVLSPSEDVILAIEETPQHAHILILTTERLLIVGRSLVRDFVEMEKIEPENLGGTFHSTPLYKIEGMERRKWTEDNWKSMGMGGGALSKSYSTRKYTEVLTIHYKELSYSISNIFSTGTMEGSNKVSISLSSDDAELPSIIKEKIRGAKEQFESDFEIIVNRFREDLDESQTAVLADYSLVNAVQECLRLSDELGHELHILLAGEVKHEDSDGGMFKGNLITWAISNNKLIVTTQTAIKIAAETGDISDLERVAIPLEDVRDVTINDLERHNRLELRLKLKRNFTEDKEDAVFDTMLNGQYSSMNFEVPIAFDKDLLTEDDLSPLAQRLLSLSDEAPTVTSESSIVPTIGMVPAPVYPKLESLGLQVDEVDGIIFNNNFDFLVLSGGSITILHLPEDWQEMFNTALGGLGGAAVGGTVGAGAGFATGAALGLLTGPLFPIFTPIFAGGGAMMGGMGGSMVGGFGGGIAGGLMDQALRKAEKYEEKIEELIDYIRSTQLSADDISEVMWHDDESVIEFGERSKIYFILSELPNQETVKEIIKKYAESQGLVFSKSKFPKGQKMSLNSKKHGAVIPEYNIDPTADDEDDESESLDKLEKLNELKEKGALTEEEFKEKKNELLDDI